MNNSDNNRLLWLWLQQACGAGSPLPELLLDAFDNSIVKLYEATQDDYYEIPFLKPQQIERLCDKKLDKAREINAYCQNEGVGILTPESALYPKRLLRIQCKPIVLYYKGILVDLDTEVCIAEVGTRTMSEYGSYISYTIAYDMAKAGAVVVSGMAKGVDGMAHRGALDAGGYTVAVLGCGIDRAYPSEHQSLMNEIIKHGVVMTEYWPFTPPYGKNFPQRNRIISGLSLGSLVTEAPARSGALITADTALKQGREVFALPGKLGEMGSAGTNELIRSGARIVTNASDILLEYQPFYADKINLNKISSLKIRRGGISVKDVASPAPYVNHKNDTTDKNNASTNAETIGNVSGQDEEVKTIIAELLRERSQYKKYGSAPQSSEVKKITGMYSRTSSKPDSFGEASKYPDASKKQSAPKTEKSQKKNSPKTVKKEEAKKGFTMPDDVSDTQKSVIKAIIDGAENADGIALKTGMQINDVLVELTMLEISGHVSALPGGKYIIN